MRHSLSLGELHISAELGAELITSLRSLIDEFAEQSNRAEGNPRRLRCSSPRSPNDHSPS